MKKFHVVKLIWSHWYLVQFCSYILVYLVLLERFVGRRYLLGKEADRMEKKGGGGNRLSAMLETQHDCILQLGGATF